MIPEHGASSMKVLCEKEKAAIRKNLKRLLNILDDTNILTPSRKAWLVDRVCEFNTQAFLKFIKGQKEHGDNFEAIVPGKEIYEEILDLFMYVGRLNHPLKLKTKKKNVKHHNTTANFDD